MFGRRTSNSQQVKKYTVTEDNLYIIECKIVVCSLLSTVLDIVTEVLQSGKGVYRGGGGVSGGG